MTHADDWRITYDEHFNAWVQSKIDDAVSEQRARAEAAEARADAAEDREAALVVEGQEKDTLIAQLRARIAELEAQLPEENPYGPVAQVFPATAEGVAAAAAHFGVPADANKVLIRATDTRKLEQIHAQAGANDVLFFENRTAPYEYDVSQGPMAPGVAAYDGIDANGKITRAVRNADGSWSGAVRITNTGSRAWFGFTRTRRGIVGLGPDVKFAPSGTLVRPSFAVLQDNGQLPASERYQYRYDANGNRAGTINGCPVKLFEAEQDNTFFANFTLVGPDNDFGGMQYSGLSIKGNGLHQVKHVRFHGCWHGTQGVPNTETGALGFNFGTYLYENCDFIPVGPATSAVMTNNSLGGQMRNNRIPKVSNGLLTHWRPTGVHIMENAHLDGGVRSFNLEEIRPGFELRWTGGSFKVDTGRHHFGINPYVPGSNQPAFPKITLVDVEVSQDAWAYVNGGRPGLDLNAYQGSTSDPIGIRKSDQRHVNDGVAQPVNCVPDVRWAT